MKKIISLILVMLIGFSFAVPVFAADSADTAEKEGCSFVEFFENIFAEISSFFKGIKYYFQVKSEKVPNTMNQNAIHMLESVDDTIGDSFIITTSDGKVIAIDGGFKNETDYFIQYLKAVTGQKKPVIDAWFLTHPHTDHVEVFYEIAENRSDKVSFNEVILNFAPYEYYADIDSTEGAEMVAEFNRISKAFPEKIHIPEDGDAFSIGEAKITMLYTFDPAFPNVNDSSLIFRMELGDKSVLFTGDAAVDSGNKVLNNPEFRALIDCDICKMSHHGQDGVSEDFYKAADPDICLWPTPTWVYNNTNGNLKTLEVREWIEEIGVEQNYKSFEGSQVIYL